MEFRKKINIPESDLNIDHQTRIMMFGSCFAENIGQRLSDSKFRINVNPFGVLYNPASIQQAIELLIEERVFSGNDVFEHQERWHTFYHHSDFSDTDKEAFIKRINDKREEATTDLKNADILLVTFGTAYVFRHKETDRIVANCHKLLSSTFTHSRLSIEDIVRNWSKLIILLREEAPLLKILFTVSPIRHWKDGAHNNQLSKATLLLAIDELSKTFDNIFYFPSYEIVLDELRDYRFYTEDMLHPNETAIRYIWEVFSDTYFDDTTKKTLHLWNNIQKALSHRPFNKDTKLHQQFLRQTLLKVNDLKNKYPYFDCEKEILKLKDQLS